MLSFDEICFFVYTSFVKEVQLKQSKEIVRETYVKVLEKAVTEIDQYYCNSKTEENVKNHLK